MRRQEGELGRRRPGAREVGGGLAAAVAERGHVVGARRGFLVGERAEPHPRVALVDLRAPPPVGLRHDPLEPRRSLRHGRCRRRRQRLRRHGLLVRQRGVPADNDRAAARCCRSSPWLRGAGLRGGCGRGGEARGGGGGILRRRRRGAHALDTHDEMS